VNVRLIILGVVVFTIVTLVLSLVFFRPPTPIIEIKAEPLLMLWDLNNDVLNVAISNTLFTAWVTMVLLILFWVFVTRNMQMIPRGLQNFGEGIIELIDNFVTGMAGPKNGRRFFPVIATFFIYIAFANWLSLTPLFNVMGIFEDVDAHHFHERAVVARDYGGVTLILPGAESFRFRVDETPCEGLAGAARTECIDHQRELAIEEETAGVLGPNDRLGFVAPYLRGINTDLMTPLAFAIVSAIFVEFWGISTLGLFTYGGKFINFRSPIDFFVGILELFAEVGRLISFSFRLFGNMLAGEILLLVMTFLIPLVSVFVVVFYGLELFVGGIQAFVFGTLTLVFAIMAVSIHGPGEHHEEEGHAEHH
jgi:F-type H+-transporting ATPase subunit a